MKMKLLSGTVLTALICGTAPALAQDADDHTREIVITANKREQNIQDVGIAVTALGQDQVRALSTQDIAATVKLVPSLQVNQYSSTSTIFNIRGVSLSDSSDAQESPIAFYNDEVYIASTGAVAGQNFDLERVEVLRGPQGTLFGRNATGGLIQVITAKPTDELSGHINLTYGRFNQVTTDVAVSGPLAAGVRGRISLTSNRNDGYTVNTLGPRENDAKFYGARGQLEFDVGNGELNAKVEYMRNEREHPGGNSQAAGYDSDGLGYILKPDEDFWTGQIGFGGPIVSCPGCDASGYKPSSDPFVKSADTPGYADREYVSATLRFTQRFGAVDFTSISNYQDLRKDYGGDVDNTPVDIFNVFSTQDLYQMSQELRLSGKSGPLLWTAGLFGLKIHSKNTLRLGNNPGPFDFFSATQRYSLNTESLAAFAQIEYEISPKFSAIVGGRYGIDWKRYNWQIEDSFGTTEAFNPTLFPDLAKRKDKDYSGKVELDFRPMDDVLLYASVNRGIKSGGFNVQGFPPMVPEDFPFGNEVLTNYEGGFKLSLADRKVNFNGTLFHYDYKGFQSFSVPAAGESKVTNLDARLTGMELELNVRPSDIVHFGVTAAHFFEAKVKNVELPFGRITDRRMPQSPDWSITANAGVDVPLGSGTLRLSTNWKYDSDQHFTTFNPQDDLEPERIVGDVRVAFDHGDYELSAFVNNVTNKTYRVFAFDDGLSLGLVQDAYAPPRWWGVSFSYRIGAR